MSVEVLKQIWPEWEIEEKPLGKGSFGVVYKAVRRDYGVESYAAIKMISIPLDSSEVESLRSEGLDINDTKTYFQGIVNEFVSEINLMESLKGVQNIVSVDDYKVVEKSDEIGWEIYIRMELLTSLNSYICDKRMSEKEVIKLGCDICSALEICSKRNIIHRDIKPENIFVNDFGFFKLGDFGIARKMENMTGGLSQKGTYNYMAPEVANSSEYDDRVDTYSLGIVLYRLLNGNRLPFLNNDQQLLNPNDRRNAVDCRLRGDNLPVPCDASPAMADVILRACAYDPEMRFPSATEMKNALMSVAEGSYKNEVVDSYDRTTSVRKASAVTNQKSAPSVNTFGSASKPKSKAPVILATILALIALLAGVFGGIYIMPKLLDRSDSTKQDEDGENTSSETADYSNFDDEQIESTINEADELADEGDYEGALTKIQEGLLTYPKSSELQDKIDEYTKAMNDQIKEKTLEEAENFADSGDYISCIAVLKKALETDSDDEDYADAYNSYCDMYKSEVISAADELAANGDYLSAIQKIGEATVVLEDDSDLSEKITLYENSYISTTVTMIDEYLEANDFSSAESSLTEALAAFPKNETLLKEKEFLQNAMPQSLFAVCPPYQTDSCKKWTNRSMGGKEYDAGVTLGGYINKGYALFNLEGKYKTLSFDVGHIDGDEMNQSHYYIYLDDKLAWSLELNPYDLPTHCEVDVSGATKMKVVGDYCGCYYGMVNVIITGSNNTEE